MFRSSSNVVTHATYDSLAGAFFVEGSAIVKRVLHDQPELQGPHALLQMALFAIAFGVISFMLGRMKTGFFLKFIPFNVTGGLLGGFGLIIMYSGWSMTLGSRPIPAFRAAIQAEDWLPLLQTGLMVLVVISLNILSKTLDAFALPAVMLIATVVFHLVPEHCRTDKSWYLPEVQNIDPFGGFHALAFGITNFHAEAIFNAETFHLFLSFFGVIYLNWGLHIPVVARLLKKNNAKQVDLNQEIMVIGKACCLTGALGGQPVAHAIGTPLQVQGIGNKNWPVMMGSLLFAAMVTNAWTAVTAVPTFVFGGTTFSYGVSLTIEWLFSSRSRIATNEWRLVVFTSVAIFVNSGLGLVLGLSFALVCFIVEYAGMSGIKQRSNLCSYRSAMQRTPRENSIIQARSHEVGIFWMHGYLFFGSISKAVDEVLEAASRGARWIVMDLALVPAVDAAGVHSLVELSRILADENVSLVLTGMVRRLALAVDNAGGVTSAVTLDYGLQMVEDDLLKTGGSLQARAQLLSAEVATVEEAWAVACSCLSSNVLTNTWQQIATVSTLRVQEAGLLFTEGDRVTDLLILMHGLVQVESLPLPSLAVREMPRWHLNAEKGDRFVFEEKPQRILTTQTPGSALNALESARVTCGFAAVASASAKALTRVQLLVVPLADITEDVMAGFFRQWLLSQVVNPQATTHTGLDLPQHSPHVAPNVLLASRSKEF